MIDSICTTNSDENSRIENDVLTLLISLIDEIDNLLLDGNKSNIFDNRTLSMKQCAEENEQENLETYTLLWCDAQMNSTNDNRQTQVELRQSINFLKTFDSADSCKLYIESKS